MSERRMIAIIKYLTALFLTLVIFSAAGITVFAEDNWSGEGTEADPYVITNYKDLTLLSDQVGSGNSFEGCYFRLGADISLGDDWKPVGSLKSGETSADNGKNILPFSGTLDGSGFTVTSADGGKSLFGYVRGAVIENLNIAGSSIKGNGLISNYVVDYGENGSFGVHTATIRNVTIKSGTSVTGSGFVSGYASAGNTVNIIGCTVEEDVVIGSGKNLDKVGSFAGDFIGTVTSCRSAATVYGRNFVGGIIGCKGNSMNDTCISGCTFTGKVIASGSYAGGISGAGYGGTRWGIQSAPNGKILSIQNCLSIGDVTASDVAGGIVGYETTVQPWNEGYIESNLFSGSLSLTSGNTKGAIVGMFRGIDRLTVVKDNFYSESCGADRGIGKISYIDTSCKTHETEYGESYFDSSGEIPVFEGINDVYPGNLKADYNRTDDPLGADAYDLARPVSDEELKDGTLTELLNKASGSMQNWKQGVNTPVMAEGKEIVSISVIDGYKDEYYTGDDFDRSSVSFLLEWTDGSHSTFAGDNDNVEITGFSSDKPGQIVLSARYRTVRTTFKITILQSPDKPVQYDTIYFTLLGDELHGDAESDNNHTRSKNNLTEWIPLTEYSVPHGSTAKDVIVCALKDASLEIRGTTENQYGLFYISGIQIPGTNDFLNEKDNGPDSGWMYAVNDEEPAVGVGEYELEDGDEIVLFYTDNYRIEKSAVGQDEVDKIRADYVAGLISALPEAADVKSDNKDAVKYASDKYNALNASQRALVADELSAKLHELIEKIAELEQKNDDGSVQKDDGSQSGGDSSVPDDQSGSDPSDSKKDSSSNNENNGSGDQDTDSDEKKPSSDQQASEKSIMAARKRIVKAFKVSVRSRRFTLRWKKTKGAGGYQVRYRIKGRKKWSVLKTTSKCRLKTRKLKKGKKYQFRVRTYNKVNGKLYCGKWTKIKTKKCK